MAACPSRPHPRWPLSLCVCTQDMNEDSACFLYLNALYWRPSDTETNWSDTHRGYTFYIVVLTQIKACLDNMTTCFMYFSTRGARWVSGVPVGNVLLPVVSHYEHQIDANWIECSQTGNLSELTWLSFDKNWEPSYKEDIILIDVSTGVSRYIWTKIQPQPKKYGSA